MKYPTNDVTQAAQRKPTRDQRYGFMMKEERLRVDDTPTVTPAPTPRSTPLGADCASVGFLPRQRLGGGGRPRSARRGSAQKVVPETKISCHPERNGGRRSDRMQSSLPPQPLHTAPGSTRVSRVGFGVPPKRTFRKRPDVVRSHRIEAALQSPARRDAATSTRDACAPRKPGNARSEGGMPLLSRRDTRRGLGHSPGGRRRCPQG